MIDINIIAVFFAVASAVLLYLYVTYKPPACPAHPACPACPEQAECPVQPPCPSFMGFELKGDYQEILDLINYIKELNKEIQDGVCGYITPGILDSVIERMRHIQEGTIQNRRSCSVETAAAQQELIAGLNQTNFSASTKGKITIALVRLMTHIPDAFCDASTGQIDLVKYESVFRNVYKAFCGKEL